MKPEHLYYKEVNAKDGNYYRRWAATMGPHMAEVIDRMLKASKHEEQAYNSCVGILHAVKDLPYGLAEEAAYQCIQMNSCMYSTFKRVLAKLKNGKLTEQASLPTHENIRGKGFYK